MQGFSPEHGNKSLLIFDSERYRFQKYISDIAGQDIDQHGNNPADLIRRIRHWLRAEAAISYPGGGGIYERYLQFRADLPQVCKELRLDFDDLSFADFSLTITMWLQRT